MNVKVTSKKDSLGVEIDGARHTLPNVLRNELWNDKTVSFSAYEKRHPYLGTPALVIKAKDAKKSLQDAVKRTEENIKDFEKKFRAAVK